MKKTIFLLVLLSSYSFATIFVTPNPPEIDANAYVLVDQHSGRVIAQKNANKKMYPASLTKLMTSYIVLNKIKEGVISLNDKVAISQKAWRTQGSRSFLKVGKKVKLEVLLKGLIIQSGNDAAVALAEHVAGSEGTFVDLMNRYAESLGMLDTKFENASGLHSKNHYTTALNLSLLSRRIIAEFPKEYQWFSQKKFRFNKITQNNRNRLLWLDKSVDGLKTGHTKKAGYCLAASAKRRNMRLISIILKAKTKSQRIEETQKLLDYGFRFFETQEVTKNKEVLVKIKVYKGSRNKVKVGLKGHNFITVARGRAKELEYKIKVNKELTAPIKKHQIVGKLDLYIEDRIVKTYPLVALEKVKLGGSFSKFIDSIKLIF
jgi:D-alanyl-D-alanine carboxypeptidase (penicillin-binding protein 5/6)